MKNALTSSALATILIVSSAKAAVIGVSDLSQTPTTANATQQNNIAIPNGGVVGDNVNGTVFYFVTTFTFGTSSQAHIETFFELSAGQDRLGVEVQDTGLVDFTNEGDPGSTSFTIAGGGAAGFMAGQTVTLLVRKYYHNTNDGLRATLGTSDDMLMTVWVNPDGTATETAVSAGDTNMLNDGDMHALWNTSDYTFLTQEIQNQGTTSGAGDNTITNTTVLTGSDATFANALALAIPEPSVALLGGLSLLVLLRRRRDS